MRKIITIDNYGDIDIEVAKMVKHVNNEHAKDSFHSSGGITFFIVGKDAIERFWKDHLEGDAFFQCMPRTNGKELKTVKMIPYLRAECHYEVGYEPHFESYATYSGCNYLLQDALEVNGFEHCLDPLKEGRYDLFNDFTDYHNFLPYNWDRENPEPNRMNVISDRGFKQWLDWRKRRQNVALTEKLKREEEIRKFRVELASMDQAACDSFIDNGDHGQIIRNGLEFSWQIMNGLHINKRLKVYYEVSNSLEAFNKMCTGNYKLAKK